MSALDFGTRRPAGTPDPDFGARWGIPVLRLDGLAQRTIARALAAERAAMAEEERTGVLRRRDRPFVPSAPPLPDGKPNIAIDRMPAVPRSDGAATGGRSPRGGAQVRARRAARGGLTSRPAWSAEGATS